MRTGGRDGKRGIRQATTLVRYIRRQAWHTSSKHETAGMKYIRGIRQANTRPSLSNKAYAIFGKRGIRQANTRPSLSNKAYAIFGKRGIRQANTGPSLSRLCLFFSSPTPPPPVSPQAMGPVGASGYGKRSVLPSGFGRGYTPKRRTCCWVCVAVRVAQWFWGAKRGDGKRGESRKSCRGGQCAWGTVDSAHGGWCAWRMARMTDGAHGAHGGWSHARMARMAGCRGAWIHLADCILVSLHLLWLAFESWYGLLRFLSVVKVRLQPLYALACFRIMV
jgi:hypothetical protein